MWISDVNSRLTSLPQVEIKWKWSSFDTDKLIILWIIFFILPKIAISSVFQVDPTEVLSRVHSKNYCVHKICYFFCNFKIKFVTHYFTDILKKNHCFILIIYYSHDVNINLFIEMKKLSTLRNFTHSIVLKKSLCVSFNNFIWIYLWNRGLHLVDW